MASWNTVPFASGTRLRVGLCVPAVLGACLPRHWPHSVGPLLIVLTVTRKVLQKHACCCLPPRIMLAFAKSLTLNPRRQPRHRNRHELPGSGFEILVCPFSGKRCCEVAEPLDRVSYTAKPSMVKPVRRQYVSQIYGRYATIQTCYWHSNQGTPPSIVQFNVRAVDDILTSPSGALGNLAWCDMGCCKSCSGFNVTSVGQVSYV